MPYFFILPAFVLYVLAMSALVALTFVYKPAAPLRPYVLSILLWSSVGFVIATIAYLLMLVAIFGVLDRFGSGQPSTAGGLAMAAVVFIGPFAAAAAGLLGGAAFGVWRLARTAGGTP